MVVLGCVSGLHLPTRALLGPEQQELGPEEQALAAWPRRRLGIDVRARRRRSTSSDSYAGAESVWLTFAGAGFDQIAARYVRRARDV